MESVTLRAETRTKGSKGRLHALRSQGIVPGVVYGRETGNLLVQFPERELEAIIAGHSIGGTLVNLEVNSAEGKGGTYLVMIREVQRDPLKKALLHADFHQVAMNQEVQTEIPVHLVGEPRGVAEGGMLQHLLREITVSGVPARLPEHLEADIGHLGIGDQLTVADLKVPEGVRVITEPGGIIATVTGKMVERVEEEGAPETGEEGEA